MHERIAIRLGGPFARMISSPYRRKSVGLAGEARCRIASNRPAKAGTAGNGSETSASTSV
jgi:hypothetical protein